MSISHLKKYFKKNFKHFQTSFLYYNCKEENMKDVDDLRDEFKKYLNDYYSDKEPMTDRKLLQLWLDCAEPREKRIKELEKENEKLKELIEKLLWKGEL